jgi:hypothetical protein
MVLEAERFHHQTLPTVRCQGHGDPSGATSPLSRTAAGLIVPLAGGERSG